MSTGIIVEVRKNVFGPWITVADPNTGKPATVPGRMIEHGTDYIFVSENTADVDGDHGDGEWIFADRRDVHIGEPWDQKQIVVGQAVSFDIITDARSDRRYAKNVAAI